MCIIQFRLVREQKHDRHLADSIVVVMLYCGMWPTQLRRTNFPGLEAKLLALAEIFQACNNYTEVDKPRVQLIF